MGARRGPCCAVRWESLIYTHVYHFHFNTRVLGCGWGPHEMGPVLRLLWAAVTTRQRTGARRRSCGAVEEWTRVTHAGIVRWGSLINIHTYRTGR